MLSKVLLAASLGDEVGVIAGQARQPVQHLDNKINPAANRMATGSNRELSSNCFVHRRCIDSVAHLTAKRIGLMAMARGQPTKHLVA